MDIPTRTAVSDVIHKFFYLVDHQRADETLALFAPAAAMEYGPGSPQPGTVQGDELRNSVLTRGEQKHITVRHLISNMLFTQQSEDVVDVAWVMVVYRSETETLDSYPRFVADVQDRFILDNGEWLLKHRKMTPIFTPVNH